MGIANPDFQTAVETFIENREGFSPLLMMRVWFNPITEPDVRYIEEATETESNDTASLQSSDRSESS